MDPDELYTLRAQFWLGHYELSVNEAKSTARRPMSPQLKTEREEFYFRALLEQKQYDKIINEADISSGPGVKAISLRAKYDSPSTPDSTKLSILSELQQLVSDPTTASSTTVQLIAAQTFLSHGEMTKEALSCVHQGTSMEHLAITIQIYLRMDRIDLAKQTLSTMKRADEESILTQLCSVYISLATGKSQAQEAVHTLGSLKEQYGASPMLLNLNAVAFMVGGRYENAEKCLMDAVTEGGGESSDTLINLIVCYQHLDKGLDEIGPLLERMKIGYPFHPFVQGLARVEGAFEREAVKYRVAA